MNIKNEDEKTIAAGCYLQCTDAFHCGVLLNKSRCLKANMHDAGVVYYNPASGGQHED